jgi:hypothetical protein
VSEAAASMHPGGGQARTREAVAGVERGESLESAVSGGQEEGPLPVQREESAGSYASDVRAYLFGLTSPSCSVPSHRAPPNTDRPDHPKSHSAPRLAASIRRL